MWKSDRITEKWVEDKVIDYKQRNRKILTKDLNMNKLCTKVVQKNLSSKQKMIKWIWSDHSARLMEEPSLLEETVTDDETWEVQYNLETKFQSLQQESQESSRMKKAWMSE